MSTIRSVPPNMANTAILRENSPSEVTQTWVHIGRVVLRCSEVVQFEDK